MLQSIVEIFYEQVVLRVCKIVGYKLAYVEIIGDEVVDFGNLSIFLSLP